MTNPKETPDVAVLRLLGEARDASEQAQKYMRLLSDGKTTFRMSYDQPEPFQTIVFAAAALETASTKLRLAGHTMREIATALREKKS